MLYKIILTKPLKQDLQETEEYITNKYSALPGARKYLADIRKRIESLQHFPEGNAIIEDISWHGTPIRSCNVRRHKIFYSVNKDKKEVTILRALYSRRNFRKIFNSSK